MKPIVVRIPVKTISESNRRGHWSKHVGRTKNQRMVTGLVMVPHVRGRDVLPCTVTITRVAPRALDDDNLRGATKAVRDGIADALGIDDRDPRVTWEYAQAEASSDGKNEMAVEVRVARRA